MHEIIPGFQIEDCDALVMMLIESVGLLSRWDHIKSEETDRILIYDHPSRKRMIFMEHTGVLGDEGLVAWIIEENVLNHPTVDRFIKFYENLRGISLEMKYDGPKHFPPNN